MVLGELEAAERNEELEETEEESEPEGDCWLFSADFLFLEQVLGGGGGEVWLF